MYNDIIKDIPNTNEEPWYINSDNDISIYVPFLSRTEEKKKKKLEKTKKLKKPVEKIGGKHILCPTATHVKELGEIDRDVIESDLMSEKEENIYGLVMVPMEHFTVKNGLLVKGEGKSILIVQDKRKKIKKYMKKAKEVCWVSECSLEHLPFYKKILGYRIVKYSDRVYKDIPLYKSVVDEILGVKN